jgi:holo-[acyl-carrier protein] synthase
VPDEVGTDIVAVDRIAALIRDHGMAFLERWFTAREIDYCSGKAVPSRHFAARFAAKEAVAKALPVAWDGPLPWRSIEIVNDPCGVPSVSLSGAILAAATRAGAGEIRVSLSHCDEYATATALVATPGAQAVASQPGPQT